MSMPLLGRGLADSRRPVRLLSCEQSIRGLGSMASDGAASQVTGRPTPGARNLRLDERRGAPGGLAKVVRKGILAKRGCRRNPNQNRLVPDVQVLAQGAPRSLPALRRVPTAPRCSGLAHTPEAAGGHRPCGHDMSTALNLYCRANASSVASSLTRSLPWA